MFQLAGTTWQVTGPAKCTATNEDQPAKFPLEEPPGVLLTWPGGGGGSLGRPGGQHDAEAGGEVGRGTQGGQLAPVPLHHQVGEPAGHPLPERALPFYCNA